ncbi:MAG: glycosyltransferase family 39 protein [Caulobacteraceae bacterium]
MTLQDRLDGLSRGWRGPLLAALVALIAGLPGIFFMPVLDRDEARFAEASAQMLESGDYTVIRFQDQPRFKKPVGIYWLQAAATKLFAGDDTRQIWSYRLPSLLGAMLAAWACAWGASAFLRSNLAALSGALLGATFLLSTEAFIAKTDAFLCGAVTLSMAALGRMYLSQLDRGPKSGQTEKLLFWLGVALSLLLKGPVGPMVMALTLAALWLWDRKASWMKDIGWGWGLVIILGLVGPWALAITVATDGAFWTTAVAGDLAPKLAGGQESHGAPPGYYLALSPFLLFPVTLLLPAALILGWKHRDAPAVRFALCWIIPTWLVFELIPTKLAHYTLPTFGALAWLMAGALAQPLGRWARLIGAGLLGLTCTVLAAALFYLLKTYGEPIDAPFVIFAALVTLATAGAAVMLLFRARAGLATASALVLGVIAHGLIAATVAPRLEPLWPAARLDLALHRLGLAPDEGRLPGPVTIAGYAEPSIVFLLGTETQLSDGAAAAAAILQGRPVIVDARETAAFRAALPPGVNPRAAGRLTGINVSNGRRLDLSIYAPLHPRAAVKDAE